MRLVMMLLLMAAACSPLQSAVSTEGAAVMAEARGVSDSAQDDRLHMLINDALFKYNVDLYRAVSVTVMEANVLLTGHVPRASDRTAVAARISGIHGIRRVINELQVDNGGGAGQYLRDSLIMAQLRTRFITDAKIVSLNYSIDCSGGVVYLMGIAQNDDELQRTIAVAQATWGVRRVVSYVRLQENLLPPVQDSKHGHPQ